MFRSTVLSILVFTTTPVLGASVLYSENGNVYLKECAPDSPRPLTRDCTPIKTSQPLEMQAYLDKLQFSTGAAPRTERGLANLEDLIEELTLSPNMFSESEARSLRATYDGVLNVIGVKRALEKGEDITIRTYKKDFSSLIAPFTDRYPGGLALKPFPKSSWSGANGAQCFYDSWNDGYDNHGCLTCIKCETKGASRGCENHFGRRFFKDLRRSETRRVPGNNGMATAGVFFYNTDVRSHSKEAEYSIEFLTSCPFKKDSYIFKSQVTASSRNRRESWGDLSQTK